MVFPNDFPPTLAVTANGVIVAAAEAFVYADSDTGFTAPLPITDQQGVPMAKLTASQSGVYPGFRVPSGETHVKAKSGDLVTPMVSLAVYANAASQSAADALAAKILAEQAAGNTAADKVDAESARDDAQDAADRAEAVPATSDGIIAGRIADGASATRAQLNAAFVTLVAAAKNPDLLIVGAVTLDGAGLVTAAAVVWPDGSPGTLTITSRDANGAVLDYTITYGLPVTRTFTQPTITRTPTGAATNVPQIVVS